MSLFSILALPSLLLCLLVANAAAFSFTIPPPRTSTTTATPNPNPFVWSLLNPPEFPAKRLIHVKPFVKIPDFKGVGSKIVGITGFGQALYLTTSTSGAYIYKVHVPTKKVTLWFKVNDRLVAESGGRRTINCDSTAHGGLRGVAFPPDFWKTGLFYTSYIEDRPKDRSKFRYLSIKNPNKNTPDSVVAEWRYNFGAGNVQWGSFREVLRIGLPVFDHPIKQIAFDGPFLLITHGDASVQSALGGGGLNNDALGKVLRIDPRKQPNGAPYRVPKDNPWVGKAKYKDEIYAVGFRNPHTICVSRQSGIFVSDAGRDNAEEINIVKKGGNYGWPLREGTNVHLAKGGTFSGISPLPKDDAKYGLIYPNVQLGHWGKIDDFFKGQAIAGSCPVENGSQFAGIYLFANFAWDGQMYYSWVNSMKNAVVTGPPGKIQPANYYKAQIVLHRNGKPPIQVKHFLEVVKSDGYPKASRADIRFGRGPQGVIYISSKTSGKLYQVLSTVPGFKG